MIILLMIALLLVFALLAWRVEKYFIQAPKVVALIAVVIASFLFCFQLFQAEHRFEVWTVIVDATWIEAFNIKLQFSLDQLSILLISLTLLLAFIAIAISWQEVSERQGFYYFNILCAIAGIIGVFAASDVFLFFVFWEVMLLPITALIAIWGHENRYFAAVKFFVFTQVSSLCMLVAIIMLAFMHQQQVGQFSFLYSDWQQLAFSPETATFLMIGFFIAFAVKLPSVPFHSWLPDAHTQAPTAGSVLLAGILLKTGAYGLIRFVILLFPNASMQFAPIAMTLGVVSVLYGAKMAFAQSDCKRLIAYSSISHMGFVMMALFAFNYNAFNGAIVTIIAHGISSAALFCLAGMIYHRIHTRDLAQMGNLALSAPWMAGVTLVFVAAAFGIPGLANFIGEFYSLLGVFAVSPLHALLAALGMIGSAIYGLRLFQTAFHGVKRDNTSTKIEDLSIREGAICLVLAVLLFLIGIYPQVLLQFTFQGGY
ncbi:NADH-quinone oxidoreductase subunit M [Thalassotalea sp. 1_MG-2023]|uniref:complex I subunit 4 family protein n=1 Tax=Thalassotalea sp. 1_MG-2023 TaxID=3062680 RepID=UPI0026E2B222|nr:NADH-quinone oxidoreductase subunit M [Thalassotalea sp. 1_MG-2023]MDO6426593.1 NADH-quinone oxidoreductase subunit M [Thalassotalea sp. 1_MG-2023]